MSLDDDIALDARLKLLENRLADDPKADPMIARSLDINDREPAVLACYLLERNAAAKEHAGLLIEQVVDYLFGDWRNSYASTEGVPDASSPTGTRSVRVTRNAAECRRQLTWMRAFRAGLLWALCLGREESVRRIASYPADDVYGEDFGGDFGSRYKSYYILLSGVVLDPGLPPAGRHVGQVERAGRKKPKLLLAALREAQRRDAGAFGKALVECIRHHIKRELPQRGLDNKLDLDSSILFHVARRDCLFLELPEKYRDHVVRFP